MSEVATDKIVPKNVQEAFEDLEARFLLILDEEDFSQADRLFFQIEQAWWFYEDFLADHYQHLPHFRRFQSFAQELFKRSTLTHLKTLQPKFNHMWAEFSEYKQQIPSYGAIILNSALDKLILVRQFNGNSWGFPKGKVNEGEDPFDCAAREVYEETGFDIKAHVSANGAEAERLEYYSKHGKETHLFLIEDVAEDTEFKPVARKEISEIKWWSINQLPKSSYGTASGDGKGVSGSGAAATSKFWQVNVFMGQLLRWIKARKLAKRKAKKSIVHVKEKEEENPSPVQTIFGVVPALLPSTDEVNFWSLDFDKILAVMKPFLE